MFDKDKLDSFFMPEKPQSSSHEGGAPLNLHSKFVRWAKLLLPSIAAILLGVLIIFPQLSNNPLDFRFDITRPKKGELEKLHIEKTTFYVTDKNNQVHNFTATNIDETAPGSKLVKLNNPEGILPINILDWFNVKAPSGYFNQNENTLQLTDNVEVFYSVGMNLETFDMTFDFNDSSGFSHSPVKAQGEFGDLKSQGFKFSSKDEILIFTGHTDITIKEESLKGK